MASLSDRDGKIRIKDNTDTIVFEIPDASGKTVYTVVAPATTTVAAIATTLSALASPSLTWTYTTQTQADNLVKAVNQLILDMQALKAVG
jgi:hypothetical protein